MGRCYMRELERHLLCGHGGGGPSDTRDARQTNVDVCSKREMLWGLSAIASGRKYETLEDHAQLRHTRGGDVNPRPLASPAINTETNPGHLCTKFSTDPRDPLIHSIESPTPLDN
jgi:hypothetical protein